LKGSKREKEILFWAEALPIGGAILMFLRSSAAGVGRQSVRTSI